MTRRGAVAALMLAAVLAGCGSADAGTQALSGRALAGPTCPVESVSPDPSCADRPVSGALLIVRDERGVEVGRATTDADGRFSIELPPGNYLIVPQPVEGLLGTASPVDVQVTAGEPTTDVLIGYDTGIR